MASNLCVKPRHDLQVVPGIADSPSGTQEVTPDLQVVDLVKLMRATCLDVAESAANSDIQLVNSTICVARALKLDGKAKEGQPYMAGLPANLAHMTWGKFVKYTEDQQLFTCSSATDCTLVSLFKIVPLIIPDLETQRALMSVRPVEYSGPALAVLRDDLMRRSTTNLSNDLGALIAYQVTMFEVGRYYYRRHTYLFETAVVVMGDGDRGFIPISLNENLDHPLELFRLIQLRDFTSVTPRRTSGGDFHGFSYGLIFKGRAESPNLTLGFKDLATAVAWSYRIIQLQSRDLSEEPGTSETEDVAAFESFAAIMQTFRWQPAFSQPLGQVLCHGVVNVGGLGRAGRFIQLVLFNQGLVFIQGSPPSIKRHLAASRITSIAKAMGKIIMTYVTEQTDLVHFEEFRFQPTEFGSDVATWLEMLRIFAPKASTQDDVHLRLRRLEKPDTQHRFTMSAMPHIAKGVVAGLATLHATLIPHELNISFAVLPAFQSDGLATHLIAHVLEVAFERFDAHRVQARVIHSATDSAETARVIRLLLHLGFAHEGIRRRAAIHPVEGQWSDVSVLAMLELDWVTRAGVTPAKGTLWDEMFLRHQREREILLKLEGSRELKRTRSMETVRDLHMMNDAVPSASMVSSSVGGSTVTSDTASQVSTPTEMSSWDGVSDASGLQTSGVQRSSLGSISSADDAADEYEEWDLEEDYSDEEDEENEFESKE